MRSGIVYLVQPEKVQQMDLPFEHEAAKADPARALA